MSGRGLPSWYKYRAYGPVYEEIRLAEHAVRLGSPVSFDRRGDVIWFDDFEHGLNKWQITGSGSGYSATASVITSRTKAMSARLVAGATEGNYLLLSRQLPRPVLGKIGLELSFCYDARLATLRLGCVIIDGEYTSYPYIRFNQATSALQYRDSTGTWQDLLTEVYPPRDAPAFNTLKLVFDAVSRQYSRALINDRGISMAGINYEAESGGTSRYLDLRVFIYTGSSGAPTAYLDDVIVTQNEP